MVLLENVLGIHAVLDEVIAALTEALPGYIIEFRILDPMLANQFSYHEGRGFCSLAFSY